MYHLFVNNTCHYNKLTIYNYIYIYRLKMKKDTFVAFIDMQKAFYWVNRDFLWYKLLVHNITGKINWAVRSIYNYNESCVKVNTLLSEWFKVSVGVRQGDNLSPTLFGIIINDLAIEMKNWVLVYSVVQQKCQFYYTQMT